MKLSLYRHFFWVLLVPVLATGFDSPAPTTATLTLHVATLNAPTGNLLYTVFNEAKGFPDKPEQAFKWGIVPVKGTDQQFTIEGLPPGRYAVGIIHDANGNRLCDRNWLGIPTEGFGFSNNAAPRWNGPPSFEASAFQLEVPGNKQTINIRY